ncbi:MAG: hypothetical protein ACODAQ_06230 [Phycisphaeraceae bacterium]
MNATLLATLPTLLAQGGNQPQPSDTNWLVIWAVLLLGAALALFFIEVFVPSGGLIGTASAVCLVAGVVLLFRINTMIGLIGATLAMIALPFAIGFAVKMFPNTPIARALTLRSGKTDEEEEAALADDTEEPNPTTAKRATAVPDGSPTVGDQGKAVSALRPVGTCLINGKREQCLAVGGTIAPGTAVQVVAVDGMHIRVKAV